MPARVTGAASSGFAVTGMGVTVPAGARPSKANSVCSWANAPSAVSAAKTARLLPSGDAPRSAVATTPVLRPPGTICCGRLVRSPAKTPPTSLLGALASGSPAGSTIDSVPIPSAPSGALANHSRPKALLIEIASGLLTEGYLALAAPGRLDAVDERGALRREQLDAAIGGA